MTNHSGDTATDCRECTRLRTALESREKAVMRVGDRLKAFVNAEELDRYLGLLADHNVSRKDLEKARGGPPLLSC